MATLFASMAAHANLVANGDFETGDFSGWTQTNLDPVWDTVYDGAPHSFFDRSFAELQDACADAWRRILSFTGVS